MADLEKRSLDGFMKSLLVAHLVDKLEIGNKNGGAASYTVYISQTHNNGAGVLTWECELEDGAVLLSEKHEGFEGDLQGRSLGHVRDVHSELYIAFYEVRVSKEGDGGPEEGQRRGGE